MAGVHLGYEKASFSSRLGDNYRQVFGPSRNLPGAFGATGKVLKINLPIILVSSPDNVEKSVLISTTTVIRKFRDSDDLADIKVGDNVAVIGTPNDKGEIEAKFIRIMPMIPTK
jgi:hypothetical protein